MDNFIYFGIYPEFLVDDIKLNGNKSVLIRINDKNHHYKLKTESLYSNILNLEIPDIPLDMVDDQFRSNIKNIFIRLNDFILNNEFDEIIVHCGAGVSRSPAVMICIAKILDNIEMELIIRDNFLALNKAIICEFTNYNYRVKDIEKRKVVYKGLYFNENKDINFNELFILNNKKKIFIKKK